MARGKTSLSPADGEGDILLSPVLLAFGVVIQGVGRAKRIYLYGVVYDQVYRHHRIDTLRVTTHSFHGRAEGSQVYHRWYAGKILQENARWHKGQFALIGCLRWPARQSDDIVLGDAPTVAVAQQRLQQHFDRVGQARDLGEAIFLQLLQAENHRRAVGGIKPSWSSPWVLKQRRGPVLCAHKKRQTPFGVSRQM
jgi:hypothetical protein